MSFQRLPNSTLSHSATLFGKVAEHCDHLVAWSLPVRATVLSTCGYPQVSAISCVLRYRRCSHGCCRSPYRQEHFLYHNSWEVFLTLLPARHA